MSNTYRDITCCHKHNKTDEELMRDKTSDKYSHKAKASEHKHNRQCNKSALQSSIRSQMEESLPVKVNH